MADLQKQADAEHTNLPSSKSQSCLYIWKSFCREETCRDTQSQQAAFLIPFGFVTEMISHSKTVYHCMSARRTKWYKMCFRNVLSLMSSPESNLFASVVQTHSSYVPQQGIMSLCRVGGDLEHRQQLIVDCDAMCCGYRSSASYLHDPHYPLLLDYPELQCLLLEISKHTALKECK